MQTVKLEKEEIYRGDLLLVNALHPLRCVDGQDLVPVAADFPDILMNRKAAKALQFIMKKISAKNSILPVSGYRSLEEQITIYDESLRDNGEEFTRKYVALPNHSEHQTGLAIDLGLNKENIDFIRPDFPYEGICEDFRKAAPDYGFIERYAREKEKITGISHEPWHFRYVGFPHSKIMEENALSLEEYMEFIKDFRDDCRFIHRQANETVTEVYYVPAESDKTSILLPESCEYQISGNNMDGFIVTVQSNSTPVTPQ